MARFFFRRRSAHGFRAFLCRLFDLGLFCRLDYTLFNLFGFFVLLNPTECRFFARELLSSLLGREFRQHLGLVEFCLALPNGLFGLGRARFGAQFCRLALFLIAQAIHHELFRSRELGGLVALSARDHIVPREAGAFFTVALLHAARILLRRRERTFPKLCRRLAQRLLYGLGTYRRRCGFGSYTVPLLLFQTTKVRIDLRIDIILCGCFLRLRRFGPGGDSRRSRRRCLECRDIAIALFARRSILKRRLIITHFRLRKCRRLCKLFRLRKRCRLRLRHRCRVLFRKRGRRLHPERLCRGLIRHLRTVLCRHHGLLRIGCRERCRFAHRILTRRGGLIVNFALQNALLIFVERLPFSLGL